MSTSIVVAVSTNGVIGHEGDLPWHLPADLAHFKRVTLGHPIVMGRKTHEAIGRVLPGRTNIVITRNPGYESADCIVTDSLEKALEIASAEDSDVFIIGGAEIFRLSLPLVDTIYLTLVHAEVSGNVTLDLDLAEWIELDRVELEADAHNQFALSFLILTRHTSR